jgi:hypothetical protein
MRVLPFFVAASLACAACGSSDSGDANGNSGNGPAPAAVLGPDTTTFDVKWKADTVLLTDADAATLDPQMSGDGTLRFVNASAAVKALTPGRLVLVPKIGLYRVKTVTPAGDAVTLTTDDASIVDAAESGHVAWDIGANHVNKSSVSVLGPRTLHVTDSAPVTFSGTIGNFTASVELTPAGDRTNVMLTAEHTPFAGRSKAEIQGYVQAFRSQGDFQFGGGIVQAFTYGVRGYHADLTVTYDFAAIKGEAEVKVPAKMSWPFLVGPIPMYVSLSANVSLQSTLTAQNDAANGTIHFTYGGDFGVLRNGASFQGSGNLGNIVLETTGAQHAAQITSGVEALFEAPQLSLGVGVPSAADTVGANLWLKVKSEVVSNLTIPDPFAAGKPSCLQVSAGAGAYYGGTLNFFGVSLASEQTIVATNKILAQSGSACH